MNNNDFEVLDLNTNPENQNIPNNEPAPANTEVQAQNLDQTAENIINEVNQAINSDAAQPAPVVPETPAAPVEPAPVEPVPAPTEAPVAEPTEAPAPAMEPQPEAPAQAMASDTPADPQDDLSNISYENKDAYNEFAEEKPKKKTSLTSIIVLIILVLALLGVAYYTIIYKDTFNLGLFKEKTTPLAAKNVEIELGSEIPTDITVYMNRALNATEYKLINNKINNNVVGEYSFDVTYNGQTYTGKATVKDTTAPVIVTKDVTVQDTTNLTADDFVESCNDLSGCVVEFDSSVDLSTMTENGNYTIALIGKDNYDNSTSISATLTIDSAAVNNKLVCTKNAKSSDYAASIVYTYDTSFDENDALTAVVDKRVYTFDNLEEYNKHRTANAGGTGTHDEATLTYKLSSNYTTETFASNKTINSFPKTKTELSAYLTKAGFTCK